LDIAGNIATNLVYNQHTHETFSVPGGRTGNMDHRLRAYMGSILPTFNPNSVLFYHNQQGKQNVGKSLGSNRVVLGAESLGIGNEWLDMYCKHNQIEQIHNINELIIKIMEKSKLN